MLPDFIGIGVRRGGSTWLWELLHAHPDAYVPPHVREAHFFNDDTAFEKGLSEYEKLFPPDAQAGRYKAVGEVSPLYITSADAAQRIRAVPQIKRLIAILRNPVDRTISHYHWRIRFDNYAGSVLDFVRDYPAAVRWSTYAEDVRTYMDLFTREELLVLIFDELFADVPAARARIARHLGLDPARFPEGAGEQRINEGGIPKHQRLYRFMGHGAKHLRRLGLYRTVDVLGRGLGLKRLAEAGGSQKLTISEQQRAELFELYRDDVAQLETVLDRSLEQWRPSV